MKSYSKYFKIADAYDFLIEEGYREEVDCIKRVGYNTNTRRLMVVGLIYDKNLLNKFLNGIWTQGNATYKINFMDTYSSRYRKRPELHICF